MTLIHWYRKFPRQIEEMDSILRKTLCDKDPSVMAASLNYFCWQVRLRPNDFKDLINTFVVILRQVVEHKLPRDFDYHRLPAPWILTKILEILAYLGRDDQTASDQMYDSIQAVLKRADDCGSNIGHALVYQCLKTITRIYPKQELIDYATMTISRFLASDSHNLKYIGISGLAQIVRIDAKYALNYQQLVVNCLEDADDTLKIITLDLLFRMTNKHNVEPIVEKLLGYLKTTNVSSIAVRKDLIAKINSLCEQFAPTKKWQVKAMNRLFEVGAELITPELTNKFIMTLSDYDREEEDPDFRETLVSTYLSLLKSAEAHLSDPMI